MFSVVGFFINRILKRNIYEGLYNRRSEAFSTKSMGCHQFKQIENALPIQNLMNTCFSLFPLLKTPK